MRLGQRLASGMASRPVTLGLARDYVLRRIVLPRWARKQPSCNDVGVRGVPPSANLLVTVTLGELVPPRVRFEEAAPPCTTKTACSFCSRSN